MVAAASASVAAMAHHPASLDAGPINGMLHGLLVFSLLLIAWGFVTFTLRRGIYRPLLLLGLLAYGVGLFGHIGAATVNGFTLPALGAQGEPIGRDVLLLAWELNQSLARLGVFMTALAYLLWSLDLLRDFSPGSRLTGWSGLLAGAVPPVALITGTLAMDVFGATLVYGLQVAWAALVGTQLMLGRLVGEEKALLTGG